MTFFDTKAEALFFVFIIVFAGMATYYHFHQEIVEVPVEKLVTVEKLVVVNQTLPCPLIQCSPCVPTEVIKKAACVCSGAYGVNNGSAWWTK